MTAVGNDRQKRMEGIHGVDVSWLHHSPKGKQPSVPTFGVIRMRNGTLAMAAVPWMMVACAYADCFAV